MSNWEYLDGADFFIEKKNIPLLEKALNMNMAQGVVEFEDSCDTCTYDPDEYGLQVEEGQSHDYATFFTALGFSIYMDEEGSIIDIGNDDPGPHNSAHTLLWAVIAPYVREGSALDFSSMDAHWSVQFWNGKAYVCDERPRHNPDPPSDDKGVIDIFVSVVLPEEGTNVPK